MRRMLCLRQARLLWATAVDAGLPEGFPNLGLSYFLQFALTSWLLCYPCNSIAEADQVLPHQVIHDQRGGKHDDEKCVMDLYHSEIGEAVVCGMQEAQAMAEQESRRSDDEGQ